MTTVAYHRAITPRGDTICIAAPAAGLDTVRHLYMYVDDDPLDLHPAQYDDTKLVQLGDRVACGGDEFTVRAMKPGTEQHTRGQIRGDSAVWYDVKYAVLLSRLSEKE